MHSLQEQMHRCKWTVASELLNQFFTTWLPGVCFQSLCLEENLLLSVSESYAVFSNLEKRHSYSWIQCESQQTMEISRRMRAELLCILKKIDHSPFSPDNGLQVCLPPHSRQPWRASIPFRVIDLFQMQAIFFLFGILFIWHLSYFLPCS